jgi:hypothetical protein
MSTYLAHYPLDRPSVVGGQGTVPGVQVPDRYQQQPPVQQQQLPQIQLNQQYPSQVDGNYGAQTSSLKRAPQTSRRANY